MVVNSIAYITFLCDFNDKAYLVYVLRGLPTVYVGDANVLHHVGYVFAAVWELVLRVRLGFHVNNLVRLGEVVKGDDILHVGQGLFMEIY